MPTRLLSKLLFGGATHVPGSSSSPVLRSPALRLLRAVCGEVVLRVRGPPPLSTSGFFWGFRHSTRPRGMIAPGFESSDGAAAPSGGPAIVFPVASWIASSPSATATAAGAGDCPAAVAVEALGSGSPGPTRATTTQIFAPMASTLSCLSSPSSAPRRRLFTRLFIT